MPSDSEKGIEQLLRKSAQTRRAQFGTEPTMPNPTRARLHDEIGRIGRAETAPEPRKSWLAAIWPRVLIGAAAAALLVAAPALFWYRSYQADQSARFAINERAAAPVAPPPVVALAEAERAEGSARQAADAVTTNGAAIAELNAKNVAKLDQQFTQTPVGARSRGSLRKTKAANVLNTFRVEQDGSTIRIIDADGSTYTGTARLVSRRAPTAAAPAAKQPAAPASRPASVAEEKAAPQDTTPESLPNEFSFRATGYNATLKKQVVFDGDYIAPAAPPAEPSQTGSARQRRAEPAARVVGKAKVAGGPAVPVDAVAASGEAER